MRKKLCECGRPLKTFKAIKNNKKVVDIKIRNDSHHDLCKQCWNSLLDSINNQDLDLEIKRGNE